MIVKYRKYVKIGIYAFLLLIISTIFLNQTYLKSKSIITSPNLNIIDLNINTLKFSNLKLNNNFRFYENVFLTDFEDVEYTNLKISNKSNKIGTYSITIKKNDNLKEFGLFIKKTFAKYEIFVDKNIIFSNFDENNHKNNLKNKYIYFDNNKEEFELVFHIKPSNHNILKFEIPIFGTKQNINILENNNTIFMNFIMYTLILICGILIIFYYFDFGTCCDITFSIGISLIFYIFQIYFLNNYIFETIFKNHNTFAIKIQYILDFLVLISIMNIFLININTTKKINLYKIYCIIVSIYTFGIINFIKESQINSINIFLTLVAFFICAYVFLNNFDKITISNYYVSYGAIICLIAYVFDILNFNTSIFCAIAYIFYFSIILSNNIKYYLDEYQSIQSINKTLMLEFNIINPLSILEKNKYEGSDENLEIHDYKHGLDYINFLKNIYFRHKHVFSIIIYEIYKFKEIKRIFGKNASSNVIQETNSIIMPVLRKTDILTYWKDDLFLIIMPNCDYQNALHVIEKMNLFLDDSIVQGYGKVDLLYGISSFLEYDSVESMIKRAEEDLEYSRKRIRKEQKNKK